MCSHLRFYLPSTTLRDQRQARLPGQMIMPVTISSRATDADHPV